MMIFSVLSALVLGRLDATTKGALDAARVSVMDVMLPQIGFIAVWMGIMRLVEKSGMIRIISKLLSPMAPPRSWSLPLLPMIESHPSSHPFVEFQHCGIGVTDAEVVHPALGVASQFVDDEAHVLPSVAFGDFPHALFEPLERFGAPFHFSSGTDLEPEERGVD